MKSNNLVEIISKNMINYENKNNKSLLETFRMFLKQQNIPPEEEDTYLVNTISTITKLGYDIISTHPLQLKKFK